MKCHYSCLICATLVMRWSLPVEFYGSRVAAAVLLHVASRTGLPRHLPQRRCLQSARLRRWRRRREEQPETAALQVQQLLAGHHPRRHRQDLGDRPQLLTLPLPAIKTAAVRPQTTTIWISWRSSTRSSWGRTRTSENFASAVKLLIVCSGTSGCQRPTASRRRYLPRSSASRRSRPRSARAPRAAPSTPLSCTGSPLCCTHIWRSSPAVTCSARDKWRRNPCSVSRKRGAIGGAVSLDTGLEGV